MIVIKYKFPLIGECDLLFAHNGMADFTARQLKNYQESYKETCHGKWQGNTIISKNKSIAGQLKKYVNDGLFLSREFKVDRDKLFLMNLIYYVEKENVRIFRKISNDPVSITKNAIHMLMNIKPDARYRSYSGMFYDRYLFPLFSLYAVCYGFHCVHGCFIKYHGKYCLFTGLDGVGKSTMGSIFANAGGKILADNVVLVNNGAALNFNIAMRLCKKERTQYKTLYHNGEFKEVLPDCTDEGIREIDHIFYFIKDECSSKIRFEERSCESDIWVHCVNSAPEINQANYILNPGRFLWNLSRPCVNEKKYNPPFVIVYIPDGGLKEASMEIKKWL